MCTNPDSRLLLALRQCASMLQLTVLNKQAASSYAMQADGLGAVAAGLRDPSPRVSRKAAQLLAALLTERPALGSPVADAAAAALPPLLGAGDRDVREAALGLAAALAEDAQAAPTLFQVIQGRLPISRVCNSFSAARTMYQSICCAVGERVSHTAG